MRFEFPENDFFSFETIPSQKVDDYLVRIEMKSGGFSATTQTHLDSVQVENFIQYVEKMKVDLKGETQLQSDDRRGLVLKISSVDSLGHFVLAIRMFESVLISTKSVERSCTAVFSLETEQMLNICSYLASCLIPSQNA